MKKYRKRQPHLSLRYFINIIDIDTEGENIQAIKFKCHFSIVDNMILTNF